MGASCPLITCTLLPWLLHAPGLGHPLLCRRWAESTYGVSKMLLIAWAKRLAAELPPGATANACCPGFCATDMTASATAAPPLLLRSTCTHRDTLARAPEDLTPPTVFWQIRDGATSGGADMSADRGQQSPTEGADTPVWLATLPMVYPSGGMFQARVDIGWH